MGYLKQRISVQLIIKLLYFFAAAVFFLLIAGGALYIISTEYDRLIASVISTVNKNGLEEKIRNSIFPLQKFELVKKISWIALVLAPFYCWLVIKYRQYVIAKCVFVCKTIWQSLKSVLFVYYSNKPSNNRAVFIVIGIIACFFLYLIGNYYLSYDEIWCYNYYTANHFYYSLFTYSSYPLFELNTHFFKWMPFPMKVNLRLSPFIFCLADFFLLYACLKKYFKDHYIAIVGLLIFCLLPFTIIYSTIAKGVMHELFFAIAAVFSLLFWLQETNRRKYLYIYVLAGIAGLYSMVPHCVLLVFLFGVGLLELVKEKDKQSIWVFIKVNLLILAGAFILYAPMFITTGFYVFGNLAQSVLSFNDVFLSAFFNLRDVMNEYSGLNKTGLFFFSGIDIVILLLLFKKKLPVQYRLMALIAIALPLSPFFARMFTGYPYASRTLAFGILGIPLSVCLILYSIKEWLGKYKMITIATGYTVFFLLLLINVYSFSKINLIDKDVAVLSNLMMKMKISSCYDNASENTLFYNYYPGIEYYYRRKNKMIEFAVKHTNSMRYKPLIQGDNYDCIVYDANSSDSSRASTYHEIYRGVNGKFKILIRNNLQ